MSRIVNLKTIRFQIFNVLDSWYTNWADHYNYAYMLYEDLGVRSYFFGICYRLKMPSNYVYIHRMAKDRLLLTHDIYLMKPLHKSKLKYYFVEQTLYLKFMLKLMFYMIPYLIKSVKIISNTRLFHYVRRVLPIKNMIYISNRISYKQLAKMRAHVIRNRLYSLVRKSNKMHYIESAHKSNGLIFLVNSNKHVTKFRNTYLSFCSSILSLIGNLISRILFVTWNQFNLSNGIPWLNELLLYIGMRYYTSVLSGKHILQVDNIDSLLRTFRFHKPQYINWSLRYKKFGIITVNRYSKALKKLLKKYQFERMTAQTKILYYNKLKVNKMFSYWFYSNNKMGITLMMFRCICLILAAVSYHKKKIRHRFSIKLINYYKKLRAIFVLFKAYQSFFVQYITNRHRRVFDVFNCRKILSPYFSRIRRIKSKFFKKRRIIMSLDAIPKYFKYGPMLIHFVDILKMYICHHIEKTLASYTKLNIHFFLSLYIIKRLNFPPIMNAKMVCDYLVYLINANKRVKPAFYKIRQWQLSNASRRLSIERLFFASRFKRKPKRYIDHFAFKKYPLFGLRIECSGNAKKGKMARKFFYGDIIHNTILTQKSPNDTLGADLDYYQSYAITKSCSIGIKVWAFFKTHLYNHNNKMSSLLFY